MAVDVIADQREHRGGQDQDRPRPPGPGRDGHRLVGDVVLLAEQEQLLLADLLPLLDEQLAPRVGLVDVGHRLPGDLAELVGVGLVVGQRRLVRQAVGDQEEEPLAERRGIERGDELAAQGIVGLVEPLAHHPVAGDDVGGFPRLADEVDGEFAAPLLVPGDRLGAEHAVADQGVERRLDPAPKVVGPLGGVARLADVFIQAGRELPLRPERLGDGVEGRGLGDGVDEVFEPLGQVLDRRGVVDHRQRDLVGPGLALGRGPDRILPREFVDPDADLAFGALAEPVGEERPGAVDDRGGRDDGEGDDGKASQPVPLAGQAALLEGDGVGGPKLGPGKFGATFTKAHGKPSPRGVNGPQGPSPAGVHRADSGATSARPPRDGRAAARLTPRRGCPTPSGEVRSRPVGAAPNPTVGLARSPRKR